MVLPDQSRSDIPVVWTFRWRQACRQGRKTGTPGLKPMSKRNPSFQSQTLALHGTSLNVAGPVRLLLLAAAVVACPLGRVIAQEAMAAGPLQARGLLAPLVGGDNANPGWLYYGLNGADRGLGYVGSYMTLGGFIPYAQDDLGGFWSADLRGHLSVYGGFFSNVGLVRKQFVGGTVLGIGVYWDYDGDQNQYSDTVITDASGSYLFAGGETYNQVGISGEWLTDWGNLRSNGYIPVGSTANTMGPFVGNSLLAVNGVNAALGGTDLEVGVYVPGLADWAGMVSVGGYAYGNAHYQFPSGADVVPWFGGVYTRLDMTFVENWDFSLQANNDSFFDWTGFARLTYRLGGSRRRNVPDQIEQPMMRNEHIVRAHKAPVQAINPTNGLPWRIIHVDNSAAVVGTGATGTGSGTFESPFRELVAGRDAATQEFDVVFVHSGISNQIPYSIPVPPADPLLNPDPLGAPPVYPNSAIASSYFFNANNQYLVGEGTSLRLNTVSHGAIPLDSGPKTGPYPVISNAAGTAIVLTNPAAAGDPGSVTNATVDHFQIQDSFVGISDGPGLPADGYASVNDVRIIGTGPSQRGVEITGLNTPGRATINFTNMRLDKLTRDGFVVDTSNGLGAADPRVNISNTVITNTDGSAIVARNLTGEGRVRVAATDIDRTSRQGILVENGQLSLYRSRVRRGGLSGLTAMESSTVQVSESVFIANDIGVEGRVNEVGSRLNLTINDNVFVPTRIGNGILIATPNNDVSTGAAEAFVNIIGNRVISNGPEDIVLFDGTGGGGVGSADIWIKAASEANLRSINANATVLNAFPNDVFPDLPPPPNYDASLVVPLPPQ
jgi:hypothetical protein